MAKIIIECPHCNKKNVEVTSEFRVEGMGVFKTYSCGHTVTEKIVKEILPEGFKKICKQCLTDVIDSQACCARPDLVTIPESRLPQFSRLHAFQQDGVISIEKANVNAILADEMGLGKTPQSLMVIAHSREQLTPTLYVVKSKLVLNWANEMLNGPAGFITPKGWLCDKNDPMDYPFIISPDGCVLPGFQHYIIGYPNLDKFKDALMAINFKCIVIDESQAFSNMASKRTKALLDIARNIPHHLSTSGTPILNRAAEYWPALHMAKPDHWHSFKSFKDHWLETNEKGKTFGIRNDLRERFFERIRPYVIRRLKREVLKDLPPFSRNFTIVDISKTAYKDSYNKEATGLDNYMNIDMMQDSAFKRATTILGYLMRMRHLTGLAKTEIALETIVDFLENTDPEVKLLVGVHHDDVMRSLQMLCAGYNPVMIPSGIDDLETKKRIEKFKLFENRLCIAKIIAAGEGLNMQFCSNVLMLERMWNPGKEMQFEARVDRYGQENPTTADYLIAKNTVDEDFTDLVEEKRRVVGETVDEDFNFEANEVLVSLLAERAARRRL